MPEPVGIWERVCGWVGGGVSVGTQWEGVIFHYQAENWDLTLWILLTLGANESFRTEVTALGLWF